MTRSIVRLALVAPIPFALNAHAHAALSISAGQTQNMSCSDNVCTATAQKAVLNVTDLTDMLASGDSTVKTGGGSIDIQILTPFSWNGSSRLTLISRHSLRIDAPVTVAGHGGVTITVNKMQTTGDLHFEKAGKLDFLDLNGKLAINGIDYKLVSGPPYLARKIAKAPSGAYALARDYDAGAEKNYKTSPVQTTFTGRFEGLGHMIANLTIRDYDQNASIGLFARISSPAVVRDIVISNLKAITGNQADYVGAVAGYADHGSVINGADVSGELQAYGFGVAAGGLVGFNYAHITRSTASVRVLAYSTTGLTGGLVGMNDGAIDSSWASGAVGGQGYDGYAGGLAGWNDGSIVLSRASGEVSREDIAVGGLVGANYGSVDSSFATGAVKQLGSTGSFCAISAGGLIGTDQTALVSNSYANGPVEGDGIDVCSGGLIGDYVLRKDQVTLSALYSMGAVSGSNAGGFLGWGRAGLSIQYGYWDIDTSGTEYAASGKKHVNGVTGFTDAQLKSGLPEGFDRKIWGQSPKINNGYPYLLANPPP